MSETLIPTHDFRWYQTDAGEVPRLQQRFGSTHGSVWRDIPRAFGFPPRETPSPLAAFTIGDQVEKHTGDYHAKGEVRGIFAMKNGAIRYVVEHPAEGGGSFCHIYSEKNLRKVES